MPKMKVVLELEQEVWNAIPQVARYLQLPSDVQSPQTIQSILEHCIVEMVFESGTKPPSRPEHSSTEALNELLDPNVSVPLRELSYHPNDPPPTKSLLEAFDDLASHHPSDPWILKVLSLPEGDQPSWKAALAATYSVVGSAERKTMETWDLIARTYRMLAKTIDNRHGEGDNGNSSPTGTNNPST